jgi:hypothetical protein
MQCNACITTDDFINNTHYNIVAYLLKARIVNSAENLLVGNGSANTPLLVSGSIAVR